MEGGGGEEVRSDEMPSDVVVIDNRKSCCYPCCGTAAFFRNFRFRTMVCSLF